LGQDLTGWRCLDAFAGSGALGFEAASREATLVQMIEMDPVLAGSLEKTRQRLNLGAEQVQVRRGDGVRALADCAKASLDLIFLDPPFDTDLGDKALPLAVKAIKNNAWIYLESPTPVSPETLDSLGLSLYRQLKAGKVFAQLLQLKSAEVQ
jgi:16S rRNA (guanine(966)-N(2))-methyltransferase RsmD